MTTFIGSSLRLNGPTANYGNQLAGCCAGVALTSGYYNNFFGAYAGYSNTYGGRNNFFGPLAGLNNSTGFHNNFFGALTGCTSTTGSCNNFFGNMVGRNNTTGSCNNFFGPFAGFCSCQTKGSNFFGLSAGYSNTFGNYNNFFGLRAGQNNTTGCNNIAIGCRSGCSTIGLFNLTTTSNRIIMGNCSHSCAQIQIGWTTVSDVRDKCIYGSIDRGLGFLKGINPIEYQFKDRENNEITDPIRKRRYGFSAQEILELEGDHPVIVSAEDPDKLQITTDHLLPIMVNAIKELSAEVETLKETVSRFLEGDG